MDREMLGLADYLNSAIHSGKAATVKYIVQALMYGVGKGHKALLVDEVPKTKEILIEREKRLEKYKTIVGLSQQIDDLQQSIEKQKKAEENLRSSKKNRGNWKMSWMKILIWKNSWRNTAAIVLSFRLRQPFLPQR